MNRQDMVEAGAKALWDVDDNGGDPYVMGARAVLDAVLPEKPAADHEIVWTFSGGGAYLSQEARCNAGPDAACRNMPECDCEEWDEQRDDQGWFHTAYIDDGKGDAIEVKHRHTKLSDCNICTWLNESDILECTGPFELEIGVTPIKPIWMGSGYDWEPAK